MDIMTVISLIATAFSICLSVIAIVLSILFFRMANEDSAKKKEIIYNIEKTTVKIEAINDKFMQSIFSLFSKIINDNYSIWGKIEDRYANVKENKIIKQTSTDVYKLINNKNSINQDDIYNIISKNLHNLEDDDIIIEKILKVLKDVQENKEIVLLEDILPPPTILPFNKSINIIHKMKHKGLIDYKEPLLPRTQLILLREEN